jgi:exodeoxyribonuclease VII small subunit
VAKRISREPDAEANAAGGETAEKVRPTFEGAIERLSAIVEELERGDLPLESSVALFEEGVLLARKAQTVLDQAEKRVEQLLGFDAQGHPVVEVLDP